MSLIRPARDQINASRNSRQYAYHRFPSNLGAHAIVLNFKKYSYDATRSGINRIDPTSSIVLPLPSNLADTYTVNANQGSLGMSGALVGAALAGGEWQADEAVKRVMNGSWNAIKSMGGEFLSTGQMPSGPPEFAAYAKFLKRAAVDTLAPGAGMAVDLATGTAINPHISVNFDGVALKSHNFNWTFAPKDAEESSKLVEIQNTIRRAMLPKYQGLGVSSGIAPLERALLEYPDLVDIFFIGIDQSYFYYFKPAMIQQFECNFSGGGGAPSILKGGKPAIVTMTMQIMETQIHTSEDYGGSYGGNLGSNPTPAGRI